MFGWVGMGMCKTEAKRKTGNEEGKREVIHFGSEF